MVALFTVEQQEFRISTSVFDNNEVVVNGKDIYLDINNKLLTYLSSFKHSQSYNSTEKDFKQKVFEDNIFGSDNPEDVSIVESQYASGKNTYRNSVTKSFQQNCVFCYFS